MVSFAGRTAGRTKKQKSKQPVKASAAAAAGDSRLTPLEQVKKIFLDKYRSTGIALTANQLLDQAKKKKITPLPPRSQIYRFIREDIAELAAFATPANLNRKTDQHQTIGVPKSGVYFIDYGEFNRDWKGSNGGSTGFIVAVENLTNKLWVEPTRGKDTTQWLQSIAKFVENSRDIKVIYSDRDAVATSKTFRDNISNKYNIRWYFLKKGNKSFLAERYIGFVKRKLGQALAGRPGQKRWVDYLKPLCEAYNSEIVSGTKFKRGAINRDNFDTFVGQLFGVADPSLERYNVFKAGPFEQESWNRAIFKFNLGDRVRLLRKANWKEGGEHNAFAKASALGSFGHKTYTIAGRQLRANRNYTRMIPLYSLNEFGARHLHFYENELGRVNEAGNSSRSNDPRPEEA